MTYRTATIGFFDGLHLGHQDLLSKVMDKSGQHNALIITFSQHPAICIQKDFSERNFRLTTNDEREKLLNGFVRSAKIVVFNFESVKSLSATEFMQLLKEKYAVGHLMLGYNSRFGSDMPNLSEYENLANKVGLDFSRLNAFSINGVHVSSSRIRKALLSGNIETANTMLGRPYSISGLVVHGRGVGHDLGFPTANLQTDPTKLIPKSGVYFGQTEISGKRFRVMVNIGSNPTFDLGNRLFVEAHVLDFCGNLYDQSLSIELLAYIREERRFTSVNALQEQIKTDCTQVQNYQI